jgi:hypothetical protein
VITIESIRNLKRELSRKSFAEDIKSAFIDDGGHYELQAEKRRF